MSEENVEPIATQTREQTLQAAIKSVPRNRAEFRFVPRKQFEWVRERDNFTVGQYLPGMSYNCSRLPVHDELFVMCAAWEIEGMIKIIGLPAGQHFVLNKVKQS